MPAMWIISRSHLKTYWESKGQQGSKQPLEDWYTVTEQADWNTWADLKATFADASHVGDCVVFNIGGNKWRLVTRLRYKAHKAFILKVMTHEEYDRLDWKSDCGCFVKPPVSTTTKKRLPKRRKN